MTNENQDDKIVSNKIQDQAILIEFHDKGKQVGFLKIKDNKISFEGNYDESAKIFVKHVIAIYQNILVDERNKIIDLIRNME